MRYLVLRASPALGDDPFLEQVAQEGTPAGLPFSGSTHELSEAEAAGLGREPDVLEVVPDIPLAMIKPTQQGPETDLDREVAWGVEAVGAAKSQYQGRNVTVAVLDTGIDIRSPAFRGRAFQHADLMDFTSDERGVPGSASDVVGHGTHVAGTIFGGEVRGTRIGVAPGIQRALIGKVLGGGESAAGSTVRLFNAIEWAFREGADIVSMSLGVDFPGLVDQLAQTGLPADIAISRALSSYRHNIRLFDRLGAYIGVRGSFRSGGLMVAASGNSSRRAMNLRYTMGVEPPAVANGIISVGAVSSRPGGDFPYSVADFSNTGCVVSAPGVDIASAGLGDDLVVMSGTSMATPHVAGVLALWIEKVRPPGLRPYDWAADVRRELETNLARVPRHLRTDLGLGIVQAP